MSVNAVAMSECGRKFEMTIEGGCTYGAAKKQIRLAVKRLERKNNIKINSIDIFPLKRESGEV